MNRLWASLSLASLLVAAPSQGQTDSERIARLEAKIDTLMTVIGDFRNTIDLSNRPPELPNREYPVLFRQRQIGVGVDAFGVRLDGLAARLAAVESRSGLGRTIRADSMILGTCSRTDIGSQLAICGQGDANIHVESNLNTLQYQNPRPHVGMWSLSGDGGLRVIQNGYLTTNCFQDVDPTNGVSYTNCLKRFVDDTREYSQVGVDSRGSWSVVRAFPGLPREYTQDVVLMIDPTTKTISWESWQSGWKWAVIASTCRTCRDVLVPLQ